LLRVSEVLYIVWRAAAPLCNGTLNIEVPISAPCILMDPD